MSDPSTSPARVLVVDDEEPICKVVTRILQSRGFTAESVSTPQEVITTAREGNFDVILLDRSLAKKGGGDLVAEIRKATPNVKILFFTGEMVPLEERKSVDGVIQKPVNGKALADALYGVLNRDVPKKNVPKKDGT